MAEPSPSRSPIRSGRDSKRDDRVGPHTVTQPAILDARLRDYRAQCSDGQPGAVHLELVSLTLDDYDKAIAFFVDKLQFDLVEDWRQDGAGSGAG